MTAERFPGLFQVIPNLENQAGEEEVGGGGDVNHGSVSVLAPILQPRQHHHLPAPSLHHASAALRRPLAATERPDGCGAAELPVADRGEASVSARQRAAIAWRGGG